MHELGYAVELIRTLEDVMEKENLKEIYEVTLTVGEATGIIPKFMYDCWPAALEDSDKIRNCKLIIKEVKAVGICSSCDNEYVVSEHHGKCPKCGSEDYNLATGYEFEISSIRAH
ncbi:MAG: hydrogenase maturation nickel metallochaperone HypA [Bacilli bacterium]|nr:hydrogenase maturation nickel metallochaperone HypA [Bacilli bacterium]